MKRFLSVLLILALAFALVACGEEETNKTESATESKTESTAVSATESTAESKTEITTESETESTIESEPEESTPEESTPEESTPDAEVMSPEEIFATLEGAGGEISMIVDFPDLQMTMIMESQNDENGSHSTMTTTMMGESMVEETYTQWIGDEAFNYYKDEDGNWYKEQVEPTENENDYAGFASLFVSDAYTGYDPATGRYTMKDDFTAQMDEFTISKGYLEIKDGTYTVYGTMSMSMEGITLEGTMTLTFGNLGGVTVTFPEVA